MTNILFFIGSAANRLYHDYLEGNVTDEVYICQLFSFIEKFQGMPWAEIDKTDSSFIYPLRVLDLLEPYGNAIETLIAQPTKEHHDLLYNAQVKLASAPGHGTFEKEIRELYNALHQA